MSTKIKEKAISMICEQIKKDEIDYETATKYMLLLMTANDIELLDTASNGRVIIKLESLIYL